MGNVLGWFGLKKSPPTPQAVRRERSPPPKVDNWKSHDAQQQAQSCTSTLQINLESKPKDEVAKQHEVDVPSQPATLPVACKPSASTSKSSSEQQQVQPSSSPFSPQYTSNEPSKPIPYSADGKHVQQNVQSLASIAKEEVRTITNNTAKISVDSAESLGRLTSQTTSAKTSTQDQATIKEGKIQKTNDAPQNNDPFEIVVICPPCEGDTLDFPTTTSDDVEDSRAADNQDTVEDAVVKIQAGIRGFLTRKALKDRFSPAPQSLTEEQVELANSEARPEKEIEEPVVKEVSTKVREIPTQVQIITSKSQLSSSSSARPQSTSKAPTSPIKEQVFYATNKAVSGQASESPKVKEKAQAVFTPPEAARTPPSKPSPQVAHAPPQFVQPSGQSKMSQQAVPSKPAVFKEEEEEEVEYEEEEDEYEEEEVEYEEEEDEPTPPASPITQIKKQVVRPPSSGSDRKH